MIHRLRKVKLNENKKGCLLRQPSQRDSGFGMRLFFCRTVFTVAFHAVSFAGFHASRCTTALIHAAHLATFHAAFFAAVFFFTAIDALCFALSHTFRCTFSTVHVAHLAAFHAAIHFTAFHAAVHFAAFHAFTILAAIFVAALNSFGFA